MKLFPFQLLFDFECFLRGKTKQILPGNLEKLACLYDGDK